MGTISKNFSYWEFEASETADRKGICNVINTFEVRDAVKALVETVLQPLRDNWGKPLHINSGYRCPELNKAVGGSTTSAHRYGYAADIVPADRRIAAFKAFCVKWLKDNAINFDQYIDEVGGGSEWVHIGIKSPSGNQRRQFLKYRNGHYMPL